MLVVPPAARVGCWLNAWISGRSSADDAISGIAAGDTAISFRGLDATVDLSPAMLLGEIRRRSVTRAIVALPTPGDLVGLGGPSSFNGAALELGQAVILSGADLGMVPSSGSGEKTWVTGLAWPPAYLPDVASADRALKESLISAAGQLAALDVASWSPDAADAIMNLRAPATWDTAMSFGSPAAARVVTSGLRSLEIVRLALRDEGGALTAAAAANRRAALAPLRRASHHAVVAGCSWLDGR